MPRTDGSTTERDAALARLPQVAVAPREGLDSPDALLMGTPADLHGVSSTAARQGRRDLMAPHAAAKWRDGYPLERERTDDEDDVPRP